MIRAILALLIFCLCAFIGYFISTFPATVVINTPNHVAVTSLISWLIISLIAAWIILIVLKLLMLIWRSPHLLSRNSRLRKQHKASRLLRNGMAELINGHFAKAEKLLVRGGDLAEEIGEPAIIYFENAAIAADNLGKYERRDQHLLKARQTAQASHSFTARLHEAELHIEHNDASKAIPILEDLIQAEPKNIKILKLLDQGYADTQSWERAWDNLKKLQSHLDKQTFEQKQKQYAQGMLNDTPAIETATELANSWRNLPQSVRDEESMKLLYAGILAENGHHQEAANFLAAEIKRKPSIDMVQAYGQIAHADASAQLKNMLRWENAFSDDALFLLAKAQIAYRAKDYKIAAEAVEASLKLQRSQAAFALWGQILEATNQPEAALVAYRESVANPDNRRVAGELLPSHEQQQLPEQSK